MSDEDFSEAVKLEVKEKAAFQCCRCRSIGIEVHHIKPKKDGGTSDIDNAAPLCPNCHTWFGDNPLKQKEIREMRDWWYKIVQQTYPDNRRIDRIEEISIIADNVIQNKTNIDELKDKLLGYLEESNNRLDEIIRNMTLGTVVTTASGIVNASASAESSISAFMSGSSASSSFSPPFTSSSSSLSSAPLSSSSSSSPHEPEPPQEEQID